MEIKGELKEIIDRSGNLQEAKKTLSKIGLVLTDEELAKVSGGADSTNGNPQGRYTIPGIQCPVKDCKGFIPISYTQLLFSEYVVCPTCGNRLELKKPENNG